MNLVEVTGLVKTFARRQTPWERPTCVRAVDGVSFTIGEGETFGLVGESGSGKTTTVRCLLRLVEPTEGSFTFRGEEVFRLGASRLRALRRDMQMVFQDPGSSLDPRMTAGAIVQEGLVIHGLGRPADRRARVRELLEMVGLDQGAAARYPHEFSGGQRQRIGIARALAVEPELIVCDEPVSALDVSVQAQIVNLLQDLQQRHGIAYLFIAHDLAVVEHVSRRILVMYLGRIVESGPASEVIRSPLHPYTQALVSAVPVVDPESRRRRIVLAGEMPSPVSPPAGCAFHPRCSAAQLPGCAAEVPALREVSPGHWAACPFAGAPPAPSVHPGALFKGPGST